MKSSLWSFAIATLLTACGAADDSAVKDADECSEDETGSWKATEYEGHGAAVQCSGSKWGGESYSRIVCTTGTAEIPATGDSQATPLCKESSGDYSIGYDFVAGRAPAPHKTLLYKTLLFSYEGQQFGLIGNDAVRDFDYIVVCKAGDTFKFDAPTSTATCETAEGELTFAGASNNEELFANAFFEHSGVSLTPPRRTCKPSEVGTNRHARDEQGNYAIAVCKKTATDYDFFEWQLDTTCKTGFPTKTGSYFVCPSAG